MTVRIVTLDDTSPHMDAVIALGDQNSHFLGHFPASCFRREASRGRVIGAITDSRTLAGYVLFRITRGRAAVQHLCVSAECHRSGIARKLVDELKRRTAHLPYIICHCAREFPAYQVWHKLGFVPLDEKKGRGKTGRPLTTFVFEHRRAELFAQHLETTSRDTVVAAMDANVAFELQDAETTHNPEALALSDDWFQQEVSLWITDEIFAEVDRASEVSERKRRKGFLRQCRALSHSPQRFEEALTTLKALTGHDRRVQDVSDLRQLAAAVAAGADAFLTRDNRLLGFADDIAAQTGLEVLTPSDLIVRFDELSRKDDYAPVRLQGSPIRLRRVAERDIDSVVQRFLNNGAGERKGVFEKALRDRLSAPRQSECAIVEHDGLEPAALIVLCEGAARTRMISFLRVRPGRLAETLCRQLLRHAIHQASQGGAALLAYEDNAPLTPADGALRTMGFVPCGQRWVKVCLKGLVTTEEVTASLAQFCLDHPVLAIGLSRVMDLCKAVTRTLAQEAELESLIWPAKLAESDIPTFVVPIQPRWAMNLFDARLGEQELFGGEPSLVLNTENVYFRSSRSRIVRPGGRILWYVSTDTTGTVQELRACSPVLSAEVDLAKALFARWRRLGVYRWDDVAAIAAGNPSGQAMAIHFGLTECFPNPVPLTDLQRIVCLTRQSDNAPPFSAPVEVPADAFRQLYRHAYGTTQKEHKPATSSLH